MLTVLTADKDSITFKKELTMINKLRINSFYNDQSLLKASEQKEFPFKLYEEIPKKLSTIFIWRNRKYLQNFIVYKYSTWADTFVERRILKETKRECINYKYKASYYLICGLITFMILMRRSTILNLFAILTSYQLSNTSFISDLKFYLNLNNHLMKFQINEKYQLGRDTRQFIKYLQNKAYLNDDSNKKFKKFIQTEILKIKFEDEYFDYLASTVVFDFHDELTKKMEAKRQLQLNKIKNHF